MDRKEIELIEQARSGSTDAFDELVRMHDHQILHMICSIVGNMHDAYDVYQETFIRAFDKLSTFRFESELSTWLGRIAINLSINWRKRQRRKNWFSLEAGAESQTSVHRETELDAAPGNGVDQELLDRELLTQIEKGLKHLPEQQRAVFILKHMHGYKIREIAEMLQSAEGTVKNHLFRATRKLQKILRPYYKGMA